VTVGSGAIRARPLEIRPARPEAADRSISYSVAGTYAIPEDAPKAAAIDGNIIEQR
jgi:hypothetical protein